LKGKKLKKNEIVKKKSVLSQIKKIAIKRMRTKYDK